MFSRRCHWSVPPNRLAEAREARRASGGEILDLTESNPTAVGLLDGFGDELADIFGRAARARYSPEARGLLSAREALAARLSQDGDPVHPDDLVITASTSEAYGFLFKLFADPGGEVVTPVPGYPLLDELATLESLALRHVAMERHGRWRLEADDVGRAFSDATRLLVVVHPNNPTGSFLARDEQSALAALCARRGVPFVSDEVFLDYPVDDRPGRAGPAAALGEGAVLSLGGLSKSAGLPHLKLGWIRIGGTPSGRAAIAAGLERVADNWLSVSTPVQQALPELLALAPRIRAGIAARTRRNLAALRERLRPLPHVESLPVEGGWCAVLRVPGSIPDDELALALLVEDGVAVQPGFFFDFGVEGYLVLSLLPEPGLFDRGVDRLAARLAGLA